MKLTAIGVGAVLASAFLTPAAAQEIACGGIYAVSPGDTLMRIARKAFGTDEFADALYATNREAIGANPSLITPGMELAIPCFAPDYEADPEADGAAGAPQIFATAVQPAPETARSAIRVVTAGGWAPFIHRGGERGGMLTEIVDAALTRVRGASGYKIDFINDWEALIDPLIADHAYDLSSAWFRPDCDAGARLGAESRRRCEALLWSDPILEQRIGYYLAPAQAARVDAHADLVGMTICRPAGFATHMLEDRGLAPPFAVVVAPAGPRDCVRGVAEGAYDVAVLAEEVADEAVAALGLEGRVVAREGLAEAATLHVVAARTNPTAAEKIEAFNEGLRRLRTSGEWFHIVSRHMAARRGASRG